MLTTASPSLAAPRHRVRELVFAYRPLRDTDGHVIDVANRRRFTNHSAPSPHISTPQKGEERTC